MTHAPPSDPDELTPQELAQEPSELPAREAMSLVRGPAPIPLPEPVPLEPPMEAVPPDERLVE